MVGNLGVFNPKSLCAPTAYIGVRWAQGVWAEPVSVILPPAPAHHVPLALEVSPCLVLPWPAPSHPFLFSLSSAAFCHLYFRGGLLNIRTWSSSLFLPCQSKALGLPARPPPCCVTSARCWPSLCPTCLIHKVARMTMIPSQGRWTDG